MTAGGACSVFDWLAAEKERREMVRGLRWRKGVTSSAQAGFGV